MKKLIVLQTVTPDYRAKLFFHLKQKLGTSFELYAGDYYFEKSVQSDLGITFKKHVKNYYLLNRKFLFQFGMWSCVFQSNIMVIELNPRILSNWIILIFRKLLRKKTVVWGHAWPRKGKNSSTDTVRGWMRKLSSQILVYTKSQQEELMEKMPNKKISFAPNSVFYKDEMLSNNNSSHINNIIYVGRLTEAKKAFFLTKAFKKAMKYLPKSAKLLIVGEGEERDIIINYINNESLTNRVQVLGHLGNYNKLKELYKTALLSASPGYVGLSITQSLSFGVPMLISRDENHSPEIEAVIEGENASFFETDSLESLSKSILSFYNEKEKWIEKRQKIVNLCKENYSIEAMSKSFLVLLH